MLAFYNSTTPTFTPAWSQSLCTHTSAHSHIHTHTQHPMGVRAHHGAKLRGPDRCQRDVWLL